MITQDRANPNIVIVSINIDGGSGGLNIPDPVAKLRNRASPIKLPTFRTNIEAKQFRRFFNFELAPARDIFSNPPSDSSKGVVILLDERNDSIFFVWMASAACLPAAA